MGWPIGVATILASTVVANIIVMQIANDDPSFAVEPDYYRKAVNFDATMAEVELARMASAGASLSSSA